MGWLQSGNLDFLAACVHGRRSRLAEGARLATLCRCRDVADLGGAVGAGPECRTAVELERWLEADLVQEVVGLLRLLEGPPQQLLAWMLARFQLQNLKVVARGASSGLPPEAVQAHLVVLPCRTELDFEWPRAPSGNGFPHLSRGPVRDSVRQAASLLGDDPQPFFFEAALDRGYFRELLARGGQLPAEEREVVRPMLAQEVDVFHVTLVVRGRFHHGLDPDVLRPWHVPGTPLHKGAFETILIAPDLAGVVRSLDGIALDAVASGPTTTPGLDVSTVESCAWARFLRLANRAFRHGHLGLGAVFGYLGLKRVAVANLIAVCEGIRAGMHPEDIQRHWLPRNQGEALHV